MATYEIGIILIDLSTMASIHAKAFSEGSGTIPYEI